MGSIYYLVPTLLAISVSLLIVRAGAIALMMTGMSFEKAKFQALSAFSGTGFTTREAERVVNNSRRRRIISTLMILGNAGIVTVIVTATSSFAMAKGLEIGLNLLILGAGITLIVSLARHAPLVRRWEDFAQSRLARLKIFDDDTAVDELLHITEGFGVVRVRVATNSGLVGKTLSEVNAGLEHSFVLGVERADTWLSSPRHHRQLAADDDLVLYGKLEELEQRFA